MKKINVSQEQRIVNHVKETSKDFSDQLQSYKMRMEKIYKNISRFDSVKSKPRETSFKVNKGHEIENKILPRILARDPKRIVSYKNVDGIDNDFSKDMADAVRDYLTHTFKKQDLKESLRLWAKSMIRYGQGRTKVGYKYSISRDSQKEMSVEVDEYGDIVESIQKKIKEKVSSEYACIESKSWTDVLFDPRYLRLEDMPCIIETARNVRLSFFTKNPKKYINIDKLVHCASAGENNDYEGYKRSVLATTGIQVTDQKIIKPSTIDVTKYYGYFDLSDSDDMSDERLYEFWLVNDTVLVYADEISCLPFEDIRCFEDTETYFAVGFVEPILGLQDEMNFKKKLR